MTLVEFISAELTRYEDDHDPAVGPSMSTDRAIFSGPS